MDDQQATEGPCTPYCHHAKWQAKFMIRCALDGTLRQPTDKKCHKWVNPEDSRIKRFD